ncbi:adhesion regulating molecule [Hesseltinella vesiculosa]|uniref:Adhesion regulating molecule n=1 Tax=Hesseltinella vesiculosa TaxID=101127 RepID=A0A1X2GD23_9FUNG|nr:adhesion regulating molecule [Hesseltinella vesiculosa]
MSFFPTPQRQSHLVEFKAGKCIRENNTLKPDVRKGIVYMDRSDDQLMHFHWKERNGSEAEDDWIIFPDEAEMIKVNECTTGRVYVLKFKSSNQKFFYWMQSSSDDKDQEVVNKVNRLINDPQSVINESRGSGRMEFGNDSHDLMQILGDGSQDISMSQENLMQFLQAAGGYGGTVPTPSRQGGDGPFDMDVDETTVQHHEDSTEPRLSDSQLATIKDVLEDVTVSETGVYELDEQVVHDLDPLLNDRDIRAALFPELPDVTSHRSQEELEQLVQSDSFQSALQTIGHALQSDLLASTLSLLELSSPITVNEFIKAMQRQANLRRQRRGQDQRNHSMEQ